MQKRGDIMGSKSTSKQTQGPSPNQQIAGDELLTWARPNLPNQKNLLDVAGTKFFDSLGGGNANPVFSEALDNIFNPNAPNFGAIRSSITPLADPTIALTSQGPSDFDINYSPGEDVATPDLGTIVGDSATQQALDQLLNRPSLFDNATGGPIVDRIDELTNQQLDAVSSRLASERADALDDANSNLAAGGLLSSNQVFRAQEEIIGNSLDDFTMQALDYSRDNIKVLSDLAMQDAQLGTQSAQAVLQAALEEKGIDANLAAQIAKTNADRAISIQTAQIQSQTQLALGQQDSETKRALGLLDSETRQALGLLDSETKLGLGEIGSRTQFGLGGQSAGLELLRQALEDFQHSQDNQLGIMSRPIDIFENIATTGPAVGSSTSTGGKSL